MKNDPRFILVTGSPRGGTTAVGRILSLGNGVGSLHEPFNYHVGLQEVERYFEIPGTSSCTDEKYHFLIQSIKALKLQFKPGVFPKEQGLRRCIKLFLGGRAINSYRCCRLNPFLHTVIWKDPFACFAIEKLLREYRMPTLVTVRNPWAVAASFKRMNWGFDLADIFFRLGQQGRHFGLQRDELWSLREQSVYNAALLWHIIYRNIIIWKKTYGAEIYILNVDSIIEQPLVTYKKIYNLLGLEWSSFIEKKIIYDYRPRKAVSRPVGNRPHDRQRDLRAVNMYWKELLTDAETSSIERLNGELWSTVKASCEKK